MHDTIYPTVPHPYIPPPGNTSANDRLCEAYLYFTVCNCRIVRNTPSASYSCIDKLGYDTRHLPVSQSVMTLEVVVFVFCAFIFKLGVGSDIVFLCVWHGKLRFKHLHARTVVVYKLWKIVSSSCFWCFKSLPVHLVIHIGLTVRLLEPDACHFSPAWRIGGWIVGWYSFSANRLCVQVFCPELNEQKRAPYFKVKGERIGVRIVLRDVLVLCPSVFLVIKTWYTCRRPSISFHYVHA